MKVTVIGLGIMGSAAAYHLAKRGHQVTAIDANERGHSLGASHGKTRIIRLAYLEAPDYVPLLKRAYELWEELEQESGKKLMTLNGGLMIGYDGSSNLVTDCRTAAEKYDVPYELLTGKQINSRFPCFAMPDDYVGVFDPSAGFLHADECLKVHQDLAVEHGATLKFNEPMLSFEARQDGVRVRTATGDIESDAIVITAGPWSSTVLERYHLPLQVVRVMFSYFNTEKAADFQPEKCPIYCIFESGGDWFYGFPYEPGGGMKIAHHGSARYSVQHSGNETCTPDSCDRSIRQPDVDLLKSKLEQYLPGAAGDYANSYICLYTLTPDEHFVIDADPANERVVYACGFSGHGFKFGSVVGEILADLALDGSTRHPIGFLSADRFLAGVDNSGKTT